MYQKFLSGLVDSRKNLDFLNILLLFLNAILLGIWAVKHTIALRNFLLVVGVVIGIIIIRREFISSELKKVLSPRYLMPLIFVALMFLWVLWHLFFMPLYPDLQISELKSTWLRAFFAVINGSAIGLLIRKNIRNLNFLWLGMLSSFFVLYCQYIPRVYETGRAYQYDPYSYIFHSKINGILAGSMLIAGLGGMTFDLVRLSSFEKNRLQVIFCVFTLCATLFAYVFIFDSRNGVGIAAFLFFFWGCLFFHKIIFNIRMRSDFSTILAPLISLLLLFAIFGFFLIQQSSYNSGWNTYFEDFSMGLQSDKYVNWRDFSNLGMPIAPSGRELSASTFERTALIVEGIKVISANPLGCGVLTHPFMKMLPQLYPGVVFAGEHATHSAWIEFGIAFGIPGLLFLIGGLLISVVNAIKERSRSPTSITTLSLALGILILYLVGEVSTQHGVEILFYFLGLIFVLQLPMFAANRLEKLA